jgi:hypothetical protein
MYRQADTGVYLDISPENKIFTEDIDLDRFFQLCNIMDIPLPIAFPSFSGLSAERFTDFTDKFLGICVLKNINDDERIRALFTLCIQGPARSYFDSLEAEQKDTWEHTLEAFQEKYAAPLSAAELQAKSLEFHRLVWQQGQELEEYAATIRDKGKQINKGDGEMAAQFICGLPEKLTFFVRSQNPITLEDAVDCAKRGHSFGYGNNKEMAASDNAQIMQNTIRDLTAAVQSLQMAHINNATATAPPTPQQPNPGYNPSYLQPNLSHPQPQYSYQPTPRQQFNPQHNPGHPQPQYPYQPTPRQQFNPQYNASRPQPQFFQQPQGAAATSHSQPPQLPSSNDCQRCGCPGHIAMACNMMDNTRPRPDFICHRCNQFGHGTVRCKSGN